MENGLLRKQQKTNKQKQNETKQKQTNKTKQTKNSPTGLIQQSTEHEKGGCSPRLVAHSYDVKNETEQNKKPHTRFALELNCCSKIQPKIKLIIFHFATDSGQSSWF